MEQKPAQLALPSPAEVYEKNAQAMYSLVRWFLPPAVANETLLNAAKQLARTVPLSGYSRYSHLIALRETYQLLKTNSSVKLPPALAALQHGFEAAFCLLLRDRMGLSCFEIGAIVGASEGSIRTRLERARAKAFGSSSAPIESKRINPEGQHFCIRAREQIEDWNIVAAKLGQFTPPLHINRAVSDCAGCENILQQRMASFSELQDLEESDLPEDLRAFPVTPLILKQGKKTALNWAAAPWYLKALFEGLLATSLVLGVVLSIPRIKSLYEFWLERRMDLYSITELAGGLGGHAESPAEPLATAAPVIQKVSDTSQSVFGPVPGLSQDAGAPAKSAEKIPVKSETEFIGRDSEVASSDKLYRVFIKTDAPETFKDQVLAVLNSVGFESADADAPAGAELPGGVIFDVFVPVKSYKKLVSDLVRAADAKVIITRNKERAVPGKARVKIWLQRI